ncbi:unnamed protein product [Lampetra fluviatilis]
MGAPSLRLLCPTRVRAASRRRVQEVVWCGRASCGSRAAGLLRYRVCGRCRLLRYCSVACQRADWRDAHRAHCVVPPPLPAPSDGASERHLRDGGLEGTP